MHTALLTIIVPVYNEQHTILTILQKLLECDLVFSVSKEIVIVNDCSTDATFETIKNFVKNSPDAPIRILTHEVNKGKGAAIHTGIAAAKGDYILIQDADLEYDPREISKLLKPLVEGHADVVYGSRFMGGQPHRILFFWHSIGNKFLTFLSNALSDLNLTDMETCYKMFRGEIIKKILLKEKRFGFEPEVTAKIARVPKIRLYEVGISYYGRTYEEGKKINWKDGVRAIYCILKYNTWAK